MSNGRADPQEQAALRLILTAPSPSRTGLQSLAIVVQAFRPAV
jgi:hypothetical protein